MPSIYIQKSWASRLTSRLSAKLECAAIMVDLHSAILQSADIYPHQAWLDNSPFVEFRYMFLFVPSGQRDRGGKNLKSRETAGPQARSHSLVSFDSPLHVGAR